MDLTDNQFKQLFEKWRGQNDLIVTLCEPRGKGGRLTFYLQFTNSKDFKEAQSYFKRENVAQIESTAHKNRLQVYQYTNSFT